jgi:4-amino-4-deoxy-L-arabinose transferase-like glycosyltransferase
MDGDAEESRIPRVMQARQLARWRLSPTTWRLISLLAASVATVFLAFYNLATFPATWFDEGAHLYAVKKLILEPTNPATQLDQIESTISVGPTVWLPIDLVFRVFGVGLVQARSVMAVYLIATLWTFYYLACSLRGEKFAIAATALVIATRPVGLVYYGRQALGEVPGLFFLLAALALWFGKWGHSGTLRLIAVGLLLGLAAITKPQILMTVVSALGISCLINAWHYRTPLRVFLIPGIVATTCVCIYYLSYLFLVLGPAAAEFLTAFREGTTTVATVFSPQVMKRSAYTLIGFETDALYGGWLVPAILYGLAVSLRRCEQEQRWNIVLTLIAVHLAWFLLASAGWHRLAFLGLALASLCVARLFHDLTDNFQFGLRRFSGAQRNPLSPRFWLQLAVLCWLVFAVALPIRRLCNVIVSTDSSAPLAMADYLNKYVSRELLIETWEKELAFLTDHNYHLPPMQLQQQWAAQVDLGGKPVSEFYDFSKPRLPPYVLVGNFSRAVNLYQKAVLLEHYLLETSIDNYELYALKNNLLTR